VYFIKKRAMENKKQTFKEVFSDMKDLFKDIFQDEIKDLKFADYKAADGTIIRTDSEEIQVGSKLQVITPDGIMDLPVEVTEIVLMVNEMPMKVYVENGVVKGIEPQEQPEEVVAAEEMNTNQEFETKFAELNERLSKLESALGISNTALEAANAQIVAQNDLNRKLFALVEKVADAPSVEPKSTAKENFKKTSSLSSLDEFRKQVFK
jgi:Tfp pilus assembly protein FimV